MPGQVGSQLQGAFQLTEDQVRILGQAGISFFNNSWAKVTTLPQGGYSVIPVDVMAELQNG
jgi:hypothetical protein